MEIFAGEAQRERFDYNTELFLQGSLTGDDGVIVIVFGAITRTVVLRNYYNSPTMLNGSIAASLEIVHHKMGLIIRYLCRIDLLDKTFTIQNREKDGEENVNFLPAPQKG